MRISTLKINAESKEMNLILQKLREVLGNVAGKT